MGVEIIVKSAVQGQCRQRARIHGIEEATEFVGRLVPDRQGKPCRRDPKIALREGRCHGGEKADGGENSRRQWLDPRFARGNGKSHPECEFPCEIYVSFRRRCAGIARFCRAMLNLNFREFKAADKSRRKTLWAASMARPLGMH